MTHHSQRLLGLTREQRTSDPKPAVAGPPRVTLRTHFLQRWQLPAVQEQGRHGIEEQTRSWPLLYPVIQTIAESQDWDSSFLEEITVLLCFLGGAMWRP